MTIIDADGFETALEDALKGREPGLVKIPEDLEKAWNELSTSEQASYRRAAEARWPREIPKKREDEARATHALRCEQAEKDRQTILDRDQVKAFRQARTPPKLQGLVDGMAQGIREQSAALRRAAAAKAEEQEKLLDAQRKRARRESGGLGGSCRQI